MKIANIIYIYIYMNEFPSQEIDNIIKKLKDKKDKSSMQTARFYLQCIEKLKFLQYGTKQYKYFV